jgi:hypothetical protein
MTLKELAERAALIASYALSKTIYRFQARLKEDPQLAALLAQVDSQLSICHRAVAQNDLCVWATACSDFAFGSNRKMRKCDPQLSYEKTKEKVISCSKGSKKEKTRRIHDHFY